MTNILIKLKQIKIKRAKEPFRPTHREKDLIQWLEINQDLNTTQASKDLNSIILKFALYSGLRISELCNLKLEHVFLDEDKILVLHGKGGKNRWVAINKALKADLVDYILNKRGKTYG
jgi:integrase